MYCIYCDRKIEKNARRKIDNGVKYMCSIDDAECTSILEKKVKEMNKIKETTKELGNGTLVNCKCGYSFVTIFPLETNPPHDICSNCETKHYQLYL